MRIIIHVFAGASMRSLLGPYKSVKISESKPEEEGVGKGLMMSDSMQVLTILTDRIEHPAGHVIHSIALNHHGNHGCGVTSLVCLAASWSREVADLRRQGIPLPVIFTVFEQCLAVCSSVVSSLSISLTRLREDRRRRHNLRSSAAVMKTRGKVTMSYSRYSRGGGGGGTGCLSRTESMSEEFLEHLGKCLCHGRELAMKLAVKAVHLQLRTMSLSTLDISKVMSLEVVGMASDHSRVVGGVACRLRGDMVHVVHGNKDKTLRTIVLCRDAVARSSHKGFQRDVMTVSGVQRSCDLGLRSHDPWLQSWQDLLEEYSVGVVAVQGVMSPTLYDHCLAKGIVVVTQLSATHTCALCHVSGTRLVHYVSQITSVSDVGMVKVVMMEDGRSQTRIRHVTNQQWPAGGEKTDYYCCVQSALPERHCDVTTVILCGHTHSQTSILRHSLQNCLNRLRCVMSDECVVRGGGWLEGKVARVLRNKGIDSGSRGSIPYHMQTGWLGHYLESLDKAAIVNGFAGGLENFAVLILRSLEPAYEIPESLESVYGNLRSLEPEYGVCSGYFQALTQVKSNQHRTEEISEHSKVGVANGGVGVASTTVLDPCSSKLASWKSAFNLVRMLMSLEVT